MAQRLKGSMARYNYFVNILKDMVFLKSFYYSSVEPLRRCTIAPFSIHR
jgi:hypothetical protein